MPVPSEILRKVEVLKNRVSDMLQTGKSHYEAPRVFELHDRWERTRREVVATEPELSFLAARPKPTPDDMTSFNGAGRVQRHELERIYGDVLDAFEVLTHPTRQSPQLSIDREGIFLAGQPFDAMMAVTSIFRAAKKSIVVVDGYVSDRTLAIISTKGDAVEASILTKSAPAALVTAAQAFKLQHAGAPLEVRTSPVFHDRFIMIDDQDVFHVGTSIKDAARRNTFMFSRIEEPPVIDAFKKHFAATWTTATLVPL